jgi:predicted GNAT family acetyltransferase
MPERIQHEAQGKRGAFFIERGGQRVAEMTYSDGHDGKVTVIDHTFVDESLRGQGIAKQLVEAAVEWARAGKHPIVPVCPFARAVFERTPEFQDVLYERPRKS